MSPIDVDEHLIATVTTMGIWGCISHTFACSPPKIQGSSADIQCSSSTSRHRYMFPSHKSKEQACCYHHSCSEHLPNYDWFQKYSFFLNSQPDSPVVGDDLPHLQISHYNIFYQYNRAQQATLIKEMMEINIGTYIVHTVNRG